MVVSYGYHASEIRLEQSFLVHAGVYLHPACFGLTPEDTYRRPGLR